MTLRKILMAATALAGIGVPAIAQGQDVVVMRRTLAPPHPRPTTPPTGSPTPTPAAWSYGDWTYADSNSCNAVAPQTRTATCMAGGTEVPAARCGTREATTRGVERLDGCTRKWDQAASPWSSECSTTATRTDVWTCRRSDGAPLPDADCSALGPKPTPITQGAQYGACTYKWATGNYSWDSYCSDSAVESRTVTCQRRPSAQGGDASVIADVSDKALCVGDGPEPGATKPPVQNISQCSYDWVYGDYGWAGVKDAYSSTCSSQAQQTRTATCYRHSSFTAPTSGKVVTGSDALCTPKPPVTTTSSGVYSTCVNMVTNGTFESGALTPWTGGRSARCANAGYGSNNSKCVGWIDQDNTMSQTISGLDVGSSYTFVVYSASASNSSAKITLQVTMTSSAGAVQTATNQFPANGGRPDANQWSTVFVATSSSMTLGIKPTAGGIGIVDDISLNIVRR